jgi:magnesium transporter
MKFTYPKWHRLAQHNQPSKLTSSAHKSGLPPGSLVHIGHIHHEESRISITQYNPDKINKFELTDITQIQQLSTEDIITWINIDGLSDTDVIQFIGEYFTIHPLVLEDILSTHQRPKLEEYEDYLYLVVKAVGIDTNEALLTPIYEQISILLLQNVIITFKEKSDDIFKPIHNRLKNPKARMRQFGADYLAYVVIDTVVDEYFVVEDHLDDVIDPLEDKLLHDPSEDILRIIQHLRRQLIYMKRSISPVRELLVEILHVDSALVKQKTIVYFADVLDHVQRVSDSLESYRERIASIQEIYLTNISNKMNETMKILTIFSTIFIPLTFIAGIYGMNFEHMPELKWEWAYPLVWLSFILTGTGLLFFFKKKKWL